MQEPGYERSEADGDVRTADDSSRDVILLHSTRAPAVQELSEALRHGAFSDTNKRPLLACCYRGNNDADKARATVDKALVEIENDAKLLAAKSSWNERNAFFSEMRSLVTLFDRETHRNDVDGDGNWGAGLAFLEQIRKKVLQALLHDFAQVLRCVCTLRPD